MNICAICIEDLDEDLSNIVKLDCKHSYHTACMLNYIKYHFNTNYNFICPLCKADISLFKIKQLIYSYNTHIKRKYQSEINNVKKLKKEIFANNCKLFLSHLFKFQTTKNTLDFIKHKEQLKIKLEYSQQNLSKLRTKLINVNKLANPYIH